MRVTSPPTGKSPPAPSTFSASYHCCSCLFRLVLQCAGFLVRYLGILFLACLFSSTLLANPPPSFSAKLNVEQRFSANLAQLLISRSAPRLLPSQPAVPALAFSPSRRPGGQTGLYSVGQIHSGNRRHNPTLSDLLHHLLYLIPGIRYGVQESPPEDKLWCASPESLAYASPTASGLPQQLF